MCIRDRVGETGGDVVGVVQLENDGGAGGARRGQHGRGVDHPGAHRQVRVAEVVQAGVAVQVDVPPLRGRGGEEGVEGAADGGVPDVEGEAEAAQVEVAGRREVRAAGARHVLAVSYTHLTLPTI